MLQSFLDEFGMTISVHEEKESEDDEGEAEKGFEDYTFNYKVSDDDYPSFTMNAIEVLGHPRFSFGPKAVVKNSFSVLQKAQIMMLPPSKMIPFQITVAETLPKLPSSFIQSIQSQQIEALFPEQQMTPNEIIPNE